MPSYFFDSSALVKLYVAEPGSGWVRRTVDGVLREGVFVARISSVEVVAALFRKVQTGALEPQRVEGMVSEINGDFLQVYRVIELGVAVTDRAVGVARRHALRGYDCVQLASALAAQDLIRPEGEARLTFVSADAALNQAAGADGLSVTDPSRQA